MAQKLFIKFKKQHGISIFHFHVRSLTKNKFILEKLIYDLRKFPEILAISETKLNDEKSKANCSKIPY